MLNTTEILGFARQFMLRFLSTPNSGGSMWKDMMQNMGTLNFIAYVLVLIGGIDLGLMGLFGFSLFGWLGGLGRLVFILIGVAAGYLIYLLAMKKKTLP